MLLFGRSFVFRRDARGGAVCRERRHAVRLGVTPCAKGVAVACGSGKVARGAAAAARGGGAPCVRVTAWFRRRGRDVRPPHGDDAASGAARPTARVSWATRPGRRMERPRRHLTVRRVRWDGRTDGARVAVTRGRVPCAAAGARRPRVPRWMACRRSSSETVQRRAAC